MSKAFHTRVGEVFAHPELGAQERLVLVAWLTHANPEGVAWPSIARLARMTSLGERTVRRELKRLRDHGLLEDRGRTPKGGLVLRYRSYPQRSAEPRPPGPVGSGSVGRSGAACQAYEQIQENKLSRTNSYPDPTSFGGGDRDQVAFILEWTRQVEVDDAWWAMAVAGDPGVVHQVSRAMEASKRQGGYRGSLRYRRIRGSLLEASRRSDAGGVRVE
ncbi:MAG: helix-turn-helix domain-containing protein [Myxococcota bacterium]